MTEDNTPQSTPPTQDAPIPPVEGSEPAPVETPKPDPGPASQEQFQAPQEQFQPETTASQAPAPEPFPAPAAPAAWTSQVAEQHLPSAAEDASMREERARRFGTGVPEPDAAPAQLSDTGNPFVTPIPAAPTQRFNTGAPLPHAEATTPMPTPQPGFPATGQGPSHYDGGQPQPGQQYPGQQHPGQPDDNYDAFEGLEEASTSRAAAHWWGVLICLIFVPVAWYLITDSGARLTYALDNSLAVPVTTYIELAGGLVCTFIFLLAARWSSLGPIIIGSLVTLLGAAFLALPEQGGDVLASAVSLFGRLGQFGVNVSQHLETTLTSGRMIFYGFTLIMIGVISHGARRQGRREERLRIALGD